MAFVSDPMQQQQQNQQPGQQGNPLANQAPVSTSSAPGAGPGTAPGTSATGAVASNQASPQPFTNLQAYLTANQPQIQQQGQTIANNLTQGYGQIQNDINSGVQTFQDKVAGGYTAPNADVVTQATTNPTKFASDPTNVKNFQAQLNDQYTGPANFESSDPYAALNSKVQKATTNAAQVNTPEGLQSYLMGMENNPTAGDTMLDQVLLQGNQDAYKGVTQAAAPYANLPAQLSSIVPPQNKAVQDAITAAQGASQNAQTQIGKTSTDFGNTLNTNYINGTKVAVDYNTQLNDIAQKMANGNFAGLTPAEQKLSGFNPNEIDTFNKYPSIFKTQAANNPINFSNYFTQGQQAAIPQASDIVTPDQIAEYQALQTLSGNAPQTSFAMPTASTSNTYSLPSDPNQLPMYNNSQALSQILANYAPFYSSMPASSVTPEIKQYMDTLTQLAGAPQLGPQPVTPPSGPPPDPLHPLPGGFGFV